MADIFNSSLIDGVCNFFGTKRLETDFQLGLNASPNENISRAGYFGPSEVRATSLAFLGRQLFLVIIFFLLPPLFKTPEGVVKGF